MWNKGSISPLLVGMQICTTTLEISMAVSQKIGNHPPSGSSNATLGHIPKGYSINYKDICSTMFITELFVIARI